MENLSQLALNEISVLNNHTRFESVADESARPQYSIVSVAFTKWQMFYNYELLLIRYLV